MLLSLDMYQTVAVAVLVLLLGSFLKKRIKKSLTNPILLAILVKLSRKKTGRKNLT